MSHQNEKPVGSEFPPPPSKDDKNIGAEYMPDKPPSSQHPPSQPPPYASGPSVNTTSTFSQQPQQPYSPPPPISPIQQNTYPLNERSLPPPPPQSGYVSPQQPQQPQQQPYQGHQQQQSFHQPYQQTYQQPYMAQQPQMRGQMQPQQVHVINMGAPVAGVQIMSHTPVRVVCPNCNNEVTTIVTETPGSTAYLWALVLFCVFFPLMWLPCVLPGCLDKTHTCPACRYVLAYIKV